MLPLHLTHAGKFDRSLQAVSNQDLKAPKGEVLQADLRYSTLTRQTQVRRVIPGSPQAKTSSFDRRSTPKKEHHLNPRASVTRPYTNKLAPK
jgi:neutral trehalase